MLLLAFHIIAVGILILVVGLIFYRLGLTEGERRTLTLIEEAREAAAEEGKDTPSKS